MTLGKFAVTLVTFVAGAGSTHANLLSNGSFEAPGYDDSLGIFNGSTGYYRELPFAGPPTMADWTISGPDKAVNWNKHTVAEGQDGTYSLFFSPNGNVGGFVSQTFPTVPGLTYNVSMIVTTGLGGVGGPVLQVSADGQVQNFEVQPLYPTWQNIFAQFLADDTQATLSLGKISNGTQGSYGFVLDAVSVEVASEVPEASTWLGAGFTALAAFLRVASRDRAKRTQTGSPLP